MISAQLVCYISPINYADVLRTRRTRWLPSAFCLLHTKHSLGVIGLSKVLFKTLVNILKELLPVGRCLTDQLPVAFLNPSAQPAFSDS